MKEKWISTERELKFEPLGATDFETIGVVQGALDDEWKVLLHCPNTLIDIYADTSDRRLLETGATFRFRTSMRKKRYRANFKGASSTEPPFFERLEIKTEMAGPEIVDMLEQQVFSGKAAEALALHLSQHTDSPWVVAPVLWIESTRRIYSFSHPSANTSQRYSVSLGNRTMYPQFALMIEEVRVRAPVGATLEQMFLWRGLDVTAARRDAVFRSAELELWGQDYGNDTLTYSAYEVVLEALKSSSRWRPVLLNKYQAATGLLLPVERHAR